MVSISKHMVHVIVGCCCWGLMVVVTAFVPRHHHLHTVIPNTQRSTLVIRSAMWQDSSAWMGYASLTLADDTSATSSLSDLVDAVTNAVPTDAAATTAAALSTTTSPDDVQAAADAAAAAAANNNGWFGFLTGPIEGLLQMIHSALVAVGVSADAWGVSIVFLTIIIKIATLPLTRTQLEGTARMQALQPTIKSIQEKYQSNPEVMNQKIAEVYQVNQVNPLAGCIPSLVQIPVFIGLYRAVLTLAKDDKLNEPFLWLPNLEGPTYGADPTHGSDWILTGWQNGTPSLGWTDTIAFLVLPVLLVVSQFISMELMQPKDAPQQNNIVLKLLPLMIGWFSLNVPAALCIYWITNNIITTATTVSIRNSLPKMETSMSGGGATATSSSSSSSAQSIFSPPRQKPTGFATKPTFSDDIVTPLTATTTTTAKAIDAEILRDQDDDDDEEDDEGELQVDDESESVTSSGTGMEKKTRGGDKRRKRRKRKN